MVARTSMIDREIVRTSNRRQRRRVEL